MAAVDVNENNNQQQQQQQQEASSAQGSNPPPTVMHLEPRPFRPFKSSEEYLWAMKEDLAEWLNALYGLDVVAENFMEKLETGVTLCQHANRVRRMALDAELQEQKQAILNNGTPRNGYRPTNNAKHDALSLTKEVVYRAEVAPGTFHARDNVSNFIAWCRSLGIYECLLFETDDLVLRKNERSFILCLLEVARQGAAVGMPVPLLVQMEHEIDREIEKEKEDEERRRRREEEKAFRCSSSSSSSEAGIEEEEEEEDGEPPPQIITNDLKSLDEMVRDLVNRCSCPVQFPMIRVSEGKYRIGDTQVLIFVRILRSHVMVRVGGGWDTLEHYLDKHDPCRCRQGHRFTVASKLMIKHSPNPAQTQMQVTYERSPDPFRIGLGNQSAGGSSSNISPARIRRASIPSIHGSRASLNSIGSDKERLAGEKTRRFSGDHSAILAALSSAGGEGFQRSSSPGGGGDTSKLSICDKSSEHSDEGYQSGSRVPSFKVHKHMPQKLLRLTEAGLIDAKSGDGSDPSQGYPGSSECSSVVSPESPCSLGEEPSLISQANTVVTNSCTPQQDSRRLKSNIPMKVSKIPKGSPALDGKLYKKSQSTENLGDQVISVPTSAYNPHKARRFSGDRGISTISAGKGHMTRSRSQCSEDSEMAAYLGYHRPGRGSLRLPRSSNGGSYIPRVSSGGNNTWSYRQRDARPALNPDLFSGRPPRASGGSQSPSPHRRRVVTPRSSPPRSLQSSPSKNVSPLLQQVLAAANGPDEKLLQRMAELVQQHYGSPKLSSISPEEVQPQLPTEIIPGENYTKYWLATSDHAPRNRHSSGTSHSLESPEDAGGGGDADHSLSVASQQSKIPLRVSPRRDSVPGSTRIPMPTFYNL